MTIPISADFFLFRKMEHAETKKIVCLLYDIHASTISDPTLAAQLDDGIEKSIDQLFKELHIKGLLQSYANLSRLFEDIDKTVMQLKRIMPHLVQQQDNLLELIKYFSLIIEDWRDIKSGRGMIALKPESLTTYFERLAGKSKIYGNIVYRTHISPMLGIGISLTGSFSAGEVISVGTTYFYNPDMRRGKAYSEESMEEVNTATVDAINQLFTKYKQSMVIVAEGYKHIVAIVKVLESQGYTTTPLIESDDLRLRMKSDEKLSGFMNALKGGDSKKLDQINVTNDLIYSLIADPLDLRKVFAEEFPGIFKEDALLSLQNNLSLMGL